MDSNGSEELSFPRANLERKRVSFFLLLFLSFLLQLMEKH